MAVGSKRKDSFVLYISRVFVSQEAFFRECTYLFTCHNTSPFKNKDARFMKTYGYRWLRCSNHSNTATSGGPSSGMDSG